jgi:hypothetical protein
MDEGNVKETATAYTVLATRLAIPPEWNWLRNFSEVASLLGKYRGQLSSVDEFIRNKQSEKSLERRRRNSHSIYWMLRQFRTRYLSRTKGYLRRLDRTL